jgi:hypothetical protein
MDLLLSSNAETGKWLFLVVNAETQKWIFFAG